MIRAQFGSFVMTQDVVSFCDYKFIASEELDFIFSFQCPIECFHELDSEVLFVWVRIPNLGIQRVVVKIHLGLLGKIEWRLENSNRSFSQIDFSLSRRAEDSVGFSELQETFREAYRHCCLMHIALCLIDFQLRQVPFKSLPGLVYRTLLSWLKVVAVAAQTNRLA